MRETGIDLIELHFRDGANTLLTATKLAA